MFIYRKLTIADEICEVLFVLKTLKTAQIFHYIRKIRPAAEDSEIEKAIEKLCNAKRIYRPLDGYLSVFPAMPKDTKNVNVAVMFFWFYIAIIDDEKLHFEAGRFPCDFVFGKDNEVYEVLIYLNDGPYKLNFLNHKKEYPDTTTVLIISLNQDETAVPMGIRPKEKHQFVSLYMKPGELDEAPKITISELYGGEENDG